MSTMIFSNPAPPRHSRFALLFVLLLSAGLLGVDLAFKYFGKAGLCATDACTTVGAYVKGGERVLVATGAIYFLILWALHFFAGRYPRQTWIARLADLLFISGAAFDGAILGYQFFSLSEFCALCLAVAAGLSVVAVLRGVNARSLAVPLLALAVWTAGLSASYALHLPRKTPGLESASFHVLKTETEYPKRWLFFSLRCPHCTEAIFALASRPVRTGSLGLCVIDLEPGELAKLDGFAASDLTRVNPLLAVLTAEVREPKPGARSSAELERAAYQANVILANTGFAAVPLLVVEHSPDRREFFSGKAAIIEYGRTMP